MRRDGPNLTQHPAMAHPFSGGAATPGRFEVGGEYSIVAEGKWAVDLKRHQVIFSRLFLSQIQGWKVLSDELQLIRTSATRTLRNGLG